MYDIMFSGILKTWKTVLDSPTAYYHAELFALNISDIFQLRPFLLRHPLNLATSVTLQGEWAHSALLQAAASKPSPEGVMGSCGWKVAGSQAQAE